MKKVLVIDDEPGIVSLLERRLAVHGYAVFTAPDGERGLEMLVRERPDVVILDIMMPKLDGFSLMQEVRSHPDVKNTPLIILTGKADMGDLFKIEGEQIVITKPFSIEDVLNKVRQMAGG